MHVAGVFQGVIVLMQTCWPGGSHVCLARPISALLSLTSFRLASFHRPVT